MISALCSLIVLAASQGWTSHYAPYVMDTVIDNRQSWGQLPVNLMMYDGFVAVPECDRIGEVVFARPMGADEWDMLLVTDCAMPVGTDGAYEWMVDNNILIEVDWVTAVRWGAVGGGARIEIGEPWLGCAI